MRYTAAKSAHSKKQFYVSILPAVLVVSISYAAVRRITSEEGAIQRLLNEKRINSLSEFALKKGDYPNSVVLNWVNDQSSLDFRDNSIFIPNLDRSAQIIDGQHRIAGLKDALEKDPSVGDLPLAVTLAEQYRQFCGWKKKEIL